MNTSIKSIFILKLIISLTLCMIVLCVFAVEIKAAPEGGQVTAGKAEIKQQGDVTDIIQSTKKAAINWQQFGIDEGETVNFNQPGSEAIALNRVLGNEKSVINGALNADGQVWILNSNGVLFDKNARINTAGLLATTKELSDQDFMAGDYDFSGDSQSSVINRGKIDISDTGYTALLGKEVINEGLIKAELGEVHLRGGREFSLDLNGNSIVNLTVTEGELNALVENREAIRADGGKVYLTTNAVDELLTGAVNNEGVVEARTIDDVMGDDGEKVSKEGQIEVFAHGGTANISGRLDASAPDGGDGGFIETSAKKVNINEKAQITTRAQAGETGKWLIDPTDFTIEEGSVGQSDSGIGASTLEDNLGNNDVEIATVESGNDRGHIYVKADISWAEATKLTLNADDNVYVEAVIENTNDTYGGVKFKIDDDAVAFEDGKGKVIINNVHQLQWINSARCTRGYEKTIEGTYELGSDIDASETSEWNNGAGFDPIGEDIVYDGWYFYGSFDGKGHTISELTINREESNIGLFGAVQGATIKNLKIVDADISGVSFVGSLAGRVDKETAVLSNISNCSSTGTVSGTGDIVGGLVGQIINTNLENSYSSADVTNIENDTGKFYGGLAGMANNSSTINNSYATGDVKAAFDVGGLVGHLSNGGVINNSYATGEVTGDEGTTGGLVGNKYTADTSINGSFWNTETSGLNNGIGNDADPASTDVTGLTTAEMQDFSNFIDAGWDLSIWRIVNGVNIEGFGTSYPYLDNNEPEKIPGQGTYFAGGWGTETEPYTITNWNELDNICFTLSNLYNYKLVNNLDENSFGYNELVKDENGLVNGGKGWEPIQDVMFSELSFHGTFDGGGNTISNLYIDRPESTDPVGLFSSIGGDSVIKNIQIVDSEITGNWSVGTLAGELSYADVRNVEIDTNISGNYAVGGITGYSSGTDIINSSAGGIISGHYLVGGLAGDMYDGEISQSQSSATVKLQSGDATGKGFLGGLAGAASNLLIENSYADGDIIDEYNYGNAGGLVGVALDNEINNSYAANKVDSAGEYQGGLIGDKNDGTVINNSFYDKTINPGMNDTEYARITEEMQDIDTFKDAGWDIVEDESLEDSYPLFADSGSIWRISPDITVLQYNMDDVIAGKYSGSPYYLHDLYSSRDIFGNQHSALEAGIDYVFIYKGEEVTKFKDTGKYSDLSIDFKNQDYAVANSGNRTGNLYILPQIKNEDDDSKEKNYNDIFGTEGAGNSRLLAVIARQSSLSTVRKNSFVNITSIPIKSEYSRKIYMSELRQNSEQKNSNLQNGTEGTDNSITEMLPQEICVHITWNSFVQLVNGGVNLPENIDQIFYIAEEQ